MVVAYSLGYMLFHVILRDNIEGDNTNYYTGVFCLVLSSINYLLPNEYLLKKSFLDFRPSVSTKSF